MFCNTFATAPFVSKDSLADEIISRVNEIISSALEIFSLAFGIFNQGSKSENFIGWYYFQIIHTQMNSLFKIALKKTTSFLLVSVLPLLPTNEKNLNSEMPLAALRTVAPA